LFGWLTCSLVTLRLRPMENCLFIVSYILVNETVGALIQGVTEELEYKFI